MRPITQEDQVPVIDHDGKDAGRRAAVFENLTPDVGQAPDGQVLVIVTTDGIVNRVDPIKLETVRVNDTGDTFYRPDGDRILAFTPTRDAARKFLAARGRGPKAKVESASGGQFNPLAPTKATDDKMLAVVRLNSAWNNCGRTSVNLLEGLREVGTLGRVVDHQRLATQHEFGGLLDELDKYTRDGKSYLADFSFEGVHTFTVEIQPWGVYLPQGYQGAYSAFWWQGLTEEPLVLPGQSTSDTQQPLDWPTFAKPTTVVRAEYGLGRLLPARALLDLLTGIQKMISLGSYRPPAVGEIAVYEPWHEGAGDVPRYWSNEAADFFRTLPFYPGQSVFDLTGVSEAKAKAMGNEKADMKARNQVSEPTPMILIMNVNEVTTPQKAFTHFGATGGEVSLCDLLLKQVTRQLLGEI
jgi:hypothetical protein